MLYGLAIALYVIVSLFLIVVVLLQPGQIRGRGGAFGGGGGGQFFGGRGASPIMKRITTGAATLFMVLSILLARAGADTSAVEGVAPKTPEAGKVDPAKKPEEAKPAEAKPVEAKPAEPAKPTEPARPTEPAKPTEAAPAPAATPAAP